MLTRTKVIVWFAATVAAGAIALSTGIVPAQASSRTATTPVAAAIVEPPTFRQQTSSLDVLPL